jgi:hypothetical protein
MRAPEGRCLHSSPPDASRTRVARGCPELACFPVQPCSPRPFPVLQIEVPAHRLQAKRERGCGRERMRDCGCLQARKENERLWLRIVSRLREREDVGERDDRKENERLWGQVNEWLICNGIEKMRRENKIFETKWQGQSC